MQVTLFRDRAEAGRQLVEHLAHLRKEPSLLVLALPRGGVPVGFQVAQAFDADLDVFLVRKLGLPGQEELAIGAVASGGVRVLNQPLIKQLRLSAGLIDAITDTEELELQRREALYRGERSPTVIRDRSVILIDDGLATGSTMKAAAQAVRQQHPGRLVIAVPVAPRNTCGELRRHADKVLCLRTPEPFGAVGTWYEHFRQVTDEEVQELLRQRRGRAAAS